FRGDACMELAGGDGEASVFVFGGGNCIEGVEFVELNPELGEYFGTDEGILVARVAESSALGLRAGDVLMAVDGREVRSTDHARRILSSYEPDEEIRLRIMRQGAETEVLARRD
ncbi:MAG: PDZ domain-containing protein, partial [Gemmatimonadetes bacterium]|nr:PDZ domain-containing protein [Gemmatimonadota bacterium]